MAKSLSNHVNNLSERIHKIKCKYWRNYKNVKFVELNVNIAIIFMNTQTLKMIYQNAYVYAEMRIIKISLMKT